MVSFVQAGRIRIAVSASGPGLDAPVDFRFGRCPYFVIVDVENGVIKSFEVIQNPAMSAFSGAGIQAAQLVANKGVNVVITGNMGPNAYGVLSSAGIQIVTATPGITVREAVQKYLNGELKPLTGPGPGGFGRGRGMGRGWGRRFGTW